jgi:hypothetical protein
MGMSYRDVLRLWGGPVEKQEFEAKREDLWLYSSKKVRFKEGKVISIMDLTEAAVPAPTPVETAAKAKSAEARAANGPKDPNAAVIQDILSEIMKGSAASGEEPNRQRPQAPPPGGAVLREPPRLMAQDPNQRAW